MKTIEVRAIRPDLVRVVQGNRLVAMSLTEWAERYNEANRLTKPVSK